MRRNLKQCLIVWKSKHLRLKVLSIALVAPSTLSLTWDTLNTFPLLNLWQVGLNSFYDIFLFVLT